MSVLRKVIPYIAITFVLTGFVGFYVVLPLIHVWSGTHPYREHRPLPSDLSAETVTFDATDGVKLAGWFFAPRNGVVIIVTHGYSGSKAGNLDQARVLMQHGYGVFAIDLRAHGDSADAPSTRGWAEVNDVLGAANWLHNRHEVAAIGALGFSIGGQVSLRAAAQDKRIGAVIAEGASTTTFGDEPPPNSLYSALNYPSAWVFYKLIGVTTGTAEPPALVDEIGTIAPRPVMLIVSGTLPSEQRVDQRYFDAARAPKSMWIVPDAGHGMGYWTHPQEYEQRMIAFFDFALGTF